MPIEWLSSIHGERLLIDRMKEYAYELYVYCLENALDVSEQTFMLLNYETYRSDAGKIHALHAYCTKIGLSDEQPEDTTPTIDSTDPNETPEATDTTEAETTESTEPTESTDMEVSLEGYPPDSYVDSDGNIWFPWG